MSELQARKRELRQRIIAARANLRAEEKAAMDAVITASLLALPEYGAAQTVLGYMNFGAEFAAEIFVQQALSDGKRVLLPKVVAHELSLFQVRDLAQDLQPGQWGIREPMAARCTRFERLDEIDFILLPGLAFTRQGARLGYGGGFYDKFLARLPHHPDLVAAAFGVQVVAEIPQEPTDKLVTCLVTESETVCCAAA